MPLPFPAEIPPDFQARRGWRLTLNGAPVEPVTGFTLEAPAFGTLAYGLLPRGYDGWCFHETGGGGVVVAPFATVDGRLHVGVIRQARAFQGGEVWNLPRGFRDPGETASQAARRELFEETGLEVPEAEILVLGPPGNPNSAFFRTDAPGEGMGICAAAVDPAQAAGRTGPDAAHEGITDFRFIPWTEAAGLGDMITNAAVARLLAHLATAPGEVRL
ncbi:NUDIX domain-containing protein [Mesoterricola sediminis]|uniref:Nudix hydrolase domain-containing protein n=1 Tax=Mesoterricola sediminis TaxID=2927980 RepID=A0AA48H8C1_9BACT|nr:NUDIX domain-containing protein [Mesoterricola sediminis]BDU77803.1 hypothetical protein METESE_27610 [Mesoterricola sediminis]